MTWQTIAYFSSVVVTCLLTGFLTWYAWRQRSIPGALFFAGLTLGECLLALAEIFSMISSTQAQASFWFTVRFLFTPVIPVFFLLFALEYYGHKDWLSRWLLAGAFIIPVLTLGFLWTNSLHRLWLVQDVSFNRIGPFWIAVTSDRIPGLWFMVHSFYSLILLMAGIAVLLVTAWNRRRVYRRQALLLSAGGLIALATTIIPVFNLIPQAEYNAFIPGIGASALLCALALFRFRFLKGTPVEEGKKRMTNYMPLEKGSLATLIIIFFLFASGITAVGYISYQNFAKQLHTQINTQLSAIFNLKVEELIDWRNERRGDASLFYHNDNFSMQVQDYLENPRDEEARAALLVWMQNIAVNPEYDRIFLLDAQGVERISVPAAPEDVPADLSEQISPGLAAGEIVFLDFHRHSKTDPVHLSYLVPIYSTQEGNRPLGVLVLRILPNIYLYPFIQNWPVPSDSAETLIIRREGEEAVFLNPLRFQPDAALNLRESLENTQLPAVKATLGQVGIVKGEDYRGIRVIADIGPVPGLPWFLVAKIDEAEVFSPLKTRLWLSIIFFGSLILSVGATLVIIWRQQRIHYFQAQLETLDALKASEEKFRLAFSTSPDSIAITRMADGKFVLVNHGFTQILGYKEEEVIGKTVQMINIWENPQDRQRMLATLQADGAVENFEAPFHTKDGLIRHGMMSAAIINLNGEPHILTTTRDITERKQADEILKSYSAHLEEEVEKRSHELKEAQEKILRQDRLASLGQLAGSISHELRNPLGVMNNAMYFLTESQPDASDEVKKYYQILEDEIHNADKIIKDLLDFSRIKSIDRRPVKPGSLVDQTLERFPVPEAVRLRLEIPQELPPVLVDPRQMVQVLGNLVANACQAMPGGGALSITAESRDGMVSISINDTGTGIPPEDMDKLFEPLFTTKPRGIGLGLSVSQKLAEANGGRIEVASEPGRGSTFTVFLPVEKEVV